MSVFSVIDFYQKLCVSICLYLLSPNLVVGAMSYISMFDCDICGWVVVFLFGRIGVHMCVSVCIPVCMCKGGKRHSFVQALILCQFGLVS